MDIIKRDIQNKKRYVGKTLQFAYPDKNGKTKIENIEILASIENAEKFDKFMNYITSLAVASGLKAFPIHNYVNKK